MEHELVQEESGRVPHSYYNNNEDLLNEMISFMRKWLLIHISGNRCWNTPIALRIPLGIPIIDSF
jgi:hemerythrin